MPSLVALRAFSRPSVLVLAVVGLSAAGCSSDTTRFDSPFTNPFASKPQVAAAPPGDVTGSIGAQPANAIESKPLPAPVQASAPLPPPTQPAAHDGVSGGGRGMASYQPAAGHDVTGSVNSQKSAAASKPAVAAKFEHVIGPGETMTGIARRYNVSIKDLAKANSVEPHKQLKMGDRLVIPGRAAAAAKPATPAKSAAAQPQPSAPAPAPVQKVAAAEPQHTARAVSPTGNVSEADAKGSAAPSFRWPVRGRIIAGFGPKPNGQQNDGINLAVPEGTPIKAAEEGVVAYAGNELKGYGNLVLIRHPNGFVTAYAHASELNVKRGDNIKRGQVIGKAGQTGTVNSPQLHFEIRKGSTPVDPTQYLNGA